MTLSFNHRFGGEFPAEIPYAGFGFGVHLERWRLPFCSSRIASASSRKRLRLGSSKMGRSDVHELMYNHAVPKLLERVMEKVVSFDQLGGFNCFKPKPLVLFDLVWGYGLAT